MPIPGTGRQVVMQVAETGGYVTLPSDNMNVKTFKTYKRHSLKMFVNVA